MKQPRQNTGNHPDPMADREAKIEAMCAAFVSDAVDLFPYEVWPDHNGDDGYRGDGGYVRLMEPSRQDATRAAMGFALDALERYADRAALAES